MPFADIRASLQAIRDARSEYGIVSRLVAGEFTLRGEAVKVVDEGDVVVGEIDRTVAEKAGLIHRTSNAVIFSPDGKVILLRRGVPDKSFYLCLSIVGGHMGLLDDYELGCKTEIMEELHLSNLPVERLESMGSELYNVPGDSNRERRQLFRCRLTKGEYEEFKTFREALRMEKAQSDREGFIAWLAEHMRLSNLQWQ